MTDISKNSMKTMQKAYWAFIKTEFWSRKYPSLKFNLNFIVELNLITWNNLFLLIFIW